MYESQCFSKVKTQNRKRMKEKKEKKPVNLLSFSNFFLPRCRFFIFSSFNNFLFSLAFGFPPLEPLSLDGSGWYNSALPLLLNIFLLRTNFVFSKYVKTNESYWMVWRRTKMYVCIFGKYTIRLLGVEMEGYGAWIITH